MEQRELLRACHEQEYGVVGYLFGAEAGAVHYHHAFFRGGVVVDVVESVAADDYRLGGVDLVDHLLWHRYAAVQDDVRTLDGLYDFSGTVDDMYVQLIVDAFEALLDEGRVHLASRYVRYFARGHFFSLGKTIGLDSAARVFPCLVKDWAIILECGCGVPAALLI